ncbi:ABC transporter [Lelliottia amnigena]|nr:ABC transporter [Lelliottia amnigena]
MHEPDILFLDEPTSGVDPITRREFWLHINSMVEKGVTVMVTTTLWMRRNIATASGWSIAAS